MNLSTNKQPKKYSWKFWLAFWLVAAVFLVGWFVFWEYKHSGYAGLLGIAKPAIRVLPVAKQQKEELAVVFDIISEISKDKQEKTWLILFQNNLELRPGGGFIGSFGIVKTKGEKVKSVEVHDTNVFDSRTSTGIDPPYPMGEMLNIKNWELRDSNWSPSFPENAKRAEEFYKLEGGEEEFDGVFAISTELLSTFLEITGPINLPDYPGEYNSENAVTKLEYQVERGYKEQDIEKGKRKYVMKELAQEIINRVQDSSWGEKKELIFALEDHLNNKDVMAYFHNQEIQERIESLGWTGKVDDFDGDYLMMVDANLGSLKSDMYVNRSFEYSVDLSGEKPQAKLAVTYHHPARARDWLTRDYDSYLRIYVPEGSWLNDTKNANVTRYVNEFEKKYFGSIIHIPINSKKTLEFNYDLPENISRENYDLLIQKQSGIKELPGTVTVIDESGIKRTYDVVVNNRWRLSEVGN